MQKECSLHLTPTQIYKRASGASAVIPENFGWLICIFQLQLFYHPPTMHAENGWTARKNRRCSKPKIHDLGLWVKWKRHKTWTNQLSMTPTICCVCLCIIVHITKLYMYSILDTDFELNISIWHCLWFVIVFVFVIVSVHVIVIFFFLAWYLYWPWSQY